MRDGDLTITTLNMEDGRELDLLPDLVSQVPDADILLMGFPDPTLRNHVSELRIHVLDMSATVAAQGVPSQGGRLG